MIDVAFHPTPQDAVQRLLDMAGVRPGEVVYDLGCGDGRVLQAARERGATAIGFDLEPRCEGAVKCNLFDVDLSNADVVFVYLLPTLNDRLLPQFRRMKSGARIVSYSFGLTGVRPTQQEFLGSTSLYMWRLPMDVKPLISLCMATYDDAKGVHETIQSLRIAHADMMDLFEIVVVDNHPNASLEGTKVSAHTRDVRNLIINCQRGGLRAQYVPFGHISGTAAPRNHAFDVASGEFVVCMDCHIQLDSDPRHPPHVLRRLVDWFLANRDTKDLITGPMVLDDLKTFSTHFNDVWSSGMWGQWGLAWACPCGRHFTTQLANGQLEYRTLQPQRVIKACECGKSFPGMAYSGHEAILEMAGYTMLGKDRNGPAFEIPAAGLGLFGCRKDAWLRFSDKFRGFGGEEFYIHEKFRQAGRKCLCLPWLRWNHRYGDADGKPGVRSPWHMMRNYVSGHHELGRSLEPIRFHYVEQLHKGSPQVAGEFAQLAASPENPPLWPEGSPNKPPKECRGCGAEPVAPSQAPPANESLDGWYPQMGANADDLKALVSKASSVADSRTATAQVELLFIGWCKTREELSTELMTKHMLRSKRWIVIYGTDHPDMMAALSNFLHHEQAWRVTDLNMGNGGLVTISKNKDDWPDEPVHVKPPGFGPGTELKAILAKLNIVPDAKCDCLNFANWMDMIGVAGCKKNRDFIVDHLKVNSDRWGWTSFLAAGWKAFTTGLVFKIGVTDPLAGCVDLAIKQAASASSLS